MPTYDYKCNKCKTVMEVTHSIKEDPEIACPDCGSRGEKTVMERLISRNSGGFIFKQWTETQHYSFKNKKIKDRNRQELKQIERYGTGPKLAPNVGGVEVESWSDAKKLAKESGLNADSYNSYINKEKTVSRQSGVDDSKWKKAKESL